MKLANSVCCCLLACFVYFAGSNTAYSQSRKHKHKDEKYEEDVSSYRPKYNASETTKEENTPKNVPAVTPQNDVSKAVEVRLDSLAHKNAQVKYGQGYRVMVYSGKSSEDVKKTRTKIYELIPDADIYTDFKSPNQRVKVGDCMDRLEANYLYGKLRKNFPNAVIIPDNIVIKAK